MKAVAEAPAKVIITGEHFVVHGAWAVAAAIPRRVRVETENSASFRVRSEHFGKSGAPELHPIGTVVDAMAGEFGFDPRIKVTVKSDVPGGAGLGSSASTMVALVASISRLKGLTIGLGETTRLSMVGEGEIHGKPSGIDPAICARGGVILFRPGSKVKQVRIRGKRSLLVSYSGVRRSTKRQISRVSSVREMFPSFFSGLVNSASEVSTLAAERLAKGDLKGLGSLMNFNQAVLSALGVSNPRLDELVDASLSLGSYGAKLTGGGGGGSVISAVPKAKEKSITSGLNARGFETFRADIPVEGVRSWLER